MLQELMEQCEKPIDYKAYKLTLTSPIEKMELVAVGRIAAIKAYSTYRKGGNMSQRNWMLMIAEQSMFKHVKKEVRKHVANTVWDEEAQARIPCKNLQLEESIFHEELESRLSVDAMEIVRLIFTMPMEYAKVFMENKPKKSRGMLRQLLTDLGWTTREISSNFREIKEFLNGYAQI